MLQQCLLDWPAHCGVIFIGCGGQSQASVPLGAAGVPPPMRAALRNSQGEKPLCHLVPGLFLRRGLMSPGNTAERAARRGKARELSSGAWGLGKGAERQRRTEPPGPWPERRCFTCSNFRRMRKVEA